MLQQSTVYGPVKSWRLGRSLGIDLLCVDSICSFACVYCQLGKINQLTRKRAVYVETERVMADLGRSDWQSADVVTFSGSGEPTLAANLGDVISGVKELTGKPVVILTNSTMLGSAGVREQVAGADKIFCKLDAWNDDVLRRVDRPAAGITLRSIVSGIRRLRKEFAGFLAIQTMILHQMSDADIEALGRILLSIRPDEVQLNLPTRPIPRDFIPESRGNELVAGKNARVLKTLDRSALEEIRNRLEAITGLPIITR